QPLSVARPLELSRCVASLDGRASVPLVDVRDLNRARPIYICQCMRVRLPRGGSGSNVACQQVIARTVAVDDPERTSREIRDTESIERPARVTESSHPAD